jgi:hypothetical protein
MSDPVSPPGRPADPSPAARIFGWLLTVLGGLWVLLTGGCTLTLMAAMAGEAGGDFGSGAGLLGIYLLIGAVCLAPGAGLLIWGLGLLRRARRERTAGD